MRRKGTEGLVLTRLEKSRTNVLKNPSPRKLRLAVLKINCTFLFFLWLCFTTTRRLAVGGGEGGFLEKIHSCDNSSSSRPRYNTQSVLLLAIPLGNERDKSESISRLNLCERYSLYSLFFFRIIYIYIRKKNLLLGRKLQSSHPPTVFSFIVKNPSFFWHSEPLQTAF